MRDPALQEDGRTLKNKLGIEHDPATLQTAEKRLVADRIRELKVHGVPQTYGFELVKAIHRHLFQDVYPFAGQPRATVLGEAEYPGLPPHYFVAPERIEAEGRRLFVDLAAQNYLKELGREPFAEQLAGFFHRLNEIHVFREGNGRTQRLVWEHVAHQAGLDLNFEVISSERMVLASIAATQGDQGMLKRMFMELLDPERAAALRQAADFFEQHVSPEFDWNLRYVATTTPGQRYDGVLVDQNRTNFILHEGPRVFIGDRRDLATTADTVTSGAPLRVTAADHRTQYLRRAQAFENEPESTALAGHPELKPIYEALRAFEAGLAEKFPQDPSSRALHLSKARTDILAKLNSGATPRDVQIVRAGLHARFDRSPDAEPERD